MRWLAIVIALCGCHDLRDYQGTWQGDVVANPALTTGISGTARLTITTANQQELHGTLDLPPTFQATPVDSIKRASGDALGSVRVGRDALQTYFAAAPNEALLVVSLFPDDRIELRVIRGVDELYGVFDLTRAH